jgi:hypothetical protein
VSPFGDTAGQGGTLTGGSAADPAAPPTGTKESAADAHATPASSGCAIGGAGNGAASTSAGLMLLALVRAGRRSRRGRARARR